MANGTRMDIEKEKELRVGKMAVSMLATGKLIRPMGKED